MATRFYLPSSGTPDITSVAFDASWEDTSIGARLPTSTSKTSTAMTTVSFTDADATNKDILFRQYVSAPLAAQTIASQTVAFVIRGHERATTCNMFTSWVIRLVSNDGSVVRGTIVGANRDNVELNAGDSADTTVESRDDTATSSAITCHSGDRLIIEIGTGGDPAAGSDHDSDLRIGDVAASDLTQGDADQDDDNPWVEFGTSTLTFFTAGDIIVHEITAVGGVAAGSSTQSHTVSANLSNPAVLAIIGASGLEANINVSSATYAGAAMTKLVESFSTELDENLEVWIKLAPSTGANNGVVTWSGSPGDGNVHWITLGNVLQSGQADATSSDTDDATTVFNTDILTVADRCFVFGMVGTNNFGANVPDSGQIQTGSTSSGFWVSSYEGPITPATTVTHGYSNGNTDDSTIVAVSIKPHVTAAAASVASGFMTTNMNYWG